MPTEPRQISLASNFAADAGGLKNVSLITCGIEADGHGIYLDEGTASSAMQKLLGKSVKSYLQHKGAGSDRLGQEIGFFSGIYRQGSQIKASAFEFLDSFKKEASNTCDKIIEMAQKVPDQFGVSLVLSYAPVWVLPDGSEVPADGSAPKNAVRGIPSMRVLDVLSADFVGRPAANPNGLLSVPVDESTKSKPELTANMATNTPVQTSTTGKSGDNGNNSPAPVSTIPSQTTKGFEEIQAEHVAALAARDGEVAKLTASLAEKETAHVTALSALKTALESEKTAALESLKKEHKDEIQKIRAELDEAHKNSAAKLGIKPINYTSELRKELSTPESKLAYYEAIKDPAEKRAFRAKNLDALFTADRARISAKS